MVEEIGGEAGSDLATPAAFEKTVDLRFAVAVFIDGQLLGGRFQFRQRGWHLDVVFFEQIRSDMQQLGLGGPDDVVGGLAFDDIGCNQGAAQSPG